MTFSSEAGHGVRQHLPFRGRRLTPLSQRVRSVMLSLLNMSSEWRIEVTAYKATHRRLSKLSSSAQASTVLHIPFIAFPVPFLFSLHSYFQEKSAGPYIKLILLKHSLHLNSIFFSSKMAPIFKITALLNLSLYVAAQGTQFITGDCTADADCASACCGFDSGKCAAIIPALERNEGCGFGEAAPNNGNGQPLAGAAAGAAAEVVDAAEVADVAPGTQFVTGECAADADCELGCCGFNTGLCAGPVIAQERDGGCGFGDAAPNDDAAQALRKKRGLGRRGVAYWM
ncbi:hypothetical protein BDV95DRAFT_512539 [Massariosphaeria phaeospora]|uniref:Biotrophy-associated secreted protein 2 n=1 Tax=Massariosphaeria phaeospora TaxID=100035 RepID=A0A7C8MVZ4_9PLEO|nr:hypothetical protein BDV95DRAFT_512539 [Massariosphaeria phaeospora]